MKSKITILALLVFLFASISLVNAQVDVTLTIENQQTVGTDFFFDIYLQATSAPANPLYLGNADFVLTFNASNFTNPTLSKEPQAGVSYGYCTFVPSDPSGSNTDITRTNYYDNTSPAPISGNELIINLNGPTPSDQNAFDTRVAKIDEQASTHRLGRFKISGISNPNGTAGLQWKTSGTGVVTQVFSMDPVTFNGSAANITAVNPNDEPLPVELTSFAAKVQGTSVKLEWKSATEVNSYGYEIQKKTGENNWTKVGFVEGAGNSNSPKKYSFVDKNLVGGTKFVYRLKIIDIDGSFEYSDEINVEVKPSKFELMQNYPNPFNPTTNIRFTLPESQNVKLDVYNMLGEKVATLLDRKMEAGFHSVNFDASQLSNGIYIYRLQAGNNVQVRKMLLMK